MNTDKRDITVNLGCELGSITNTPINNDCLLIHIKTPDGVRVSVVSSVGEDNLYIIGVIPVSNTKIKHDEAKCTPDTMPKTMDSRFSKPIRRKKIKVTANDNDNDNDSETLDIKLCSTCYRNPCTCSSKSGSTDEYLSSVVKKYNIDVDFEKDNIKLAVLRLALQNTHKDPVFFRNIIASFVMNWKKAEDTNTFHNGSTLTHVEVPTVITASGLSNLNLFTPECRPEDDYEVLDIVRDSWSESMQENFRALLLIPAGMFYEVGNFSKAALTVIIDNIVVKNNEVSEGE